MKKDRKRAMTAVEMIISLVIVVIILGVIIQLYVKASGMFKKGSERLDIVQTYILVMERLKRDLRGAYKAEIPAVSGARELHITTLDVDPASGLPIPVYNDQHRLFRESPGKIIYTFTVTSPESTELVRTDQKGNREVLSTSLKDVEFKLESVKVNDLSTPFIRVKLISKLLDPADTTSTIIIPRFFSAWARQPSWVLNHIGQRFNLIKEE